jgi:hypothetical protein
LESKPFAGVQTFKFGRKPIYTQEANQFSGKNFAERILPENIFLRNLSSFGVTTGKPLWYEINITWGLAPENPSYGHVEYIVQKNIDNY